MSDITMFKNIAGYKTVKRELLRIREWVLNKNNLNDPNIKLPKGIIFYGDPGNGKTLFMKEYSESFNSPIFNIVGDKDNACEEVHRAFSLSKQYDFSIILIDEIDLLIGRHCDVERTLQSELDGIESVSNVLVLASTNSILDLNDALLRSGRFDRSIKIGCPNKESRKQLFDFYLNKLGIKTEVDTDYLSHIMHGICGADVASIVNDVYLRCGTTPTTNDVEDSYYRIIDHRYDTSEDYDPSKANVETAYHEVAHAVLIYKHRDMFRFYKAFFSTDSKSGLTRFYPIDDDITTSQSFFKQIEVGLAGYVMTKLKFHRLDDGCVRDLQDCRMNAVLLVNKLGYKGPQCVLPYYSREARMETDIRKRRNERTIERIIKKSLKITKKYIKTHMNEAESLVNIMMNKGYINYSDLVMVMEHVNNEKIVSFMNENHQLVEEHA